MTMMRNFGLGRRAFLIAASMGAIVAVQGCGEASGGEPAAASATPTKAPPKAAAKDVYTRSLHFVYSKTMRDKYTDAQMLGFFDQVPGGLTAIVPFLLNVPDASVDAPIIAELKKRGITIVPGAGAKPKDGPINMQKFKDMAKNYRPYTDYIRLENTQGYYDMYGADEIQDLIDYCVSLGFKHIMLNPWPNAAGGVAVPFKNPELDATIHQVKLKHNRQTHEIIPDPENWFPGNQNKIDAIRKWRPGIAVIINYESAPQHQALTKLEQDHPGASKDAMEITASMILKGNKQLHWEPPFTMNYDPVALGTWDWEAKRLGDFK